MTSDQWSVDLYGISTALAIHSLAGSIRGDKKSQPAMDWLIGFRRSLVVTCAAMFAACFTRSAVFAS